MTAAQDMNRKKVAEILLVEDNPEDVVLTKNAFKQLEIPCNITVAPSGEQALTILRQEGKYVFSNKPALVLLDLGLPKTEGIEVLKQIKNDPGLRDIPVIVLTGSLEETNVMKSYDHYAHSYIVKPIDLTRQHIIQDLLRIHGYK